MRRGRRNILSRSWVTRGSKKILDMSEMDSVAINHAILDTPKRPKRATIHGRVLKVRIPFHLRYFLISRSLELKRLSFFCNRDLRKTKG